MINNPLVSIIMPTYNHVDFITNSIVSVINQTYKYWELIIVNDCSSDNTLLKINEYLSHPKIKLINHKTNWGINKLKDTYNQALYYSKGKLISILEGDDFWPVNKLKTQIAFFNNRDIVMSYGDWIMTDSFGNGIYLKKYNYNKDKLNNIPTASIIELYAQTQFNIISSTTMFSREALLKIHGFQGAKHYPFIDIPTYLAISRIGHFKYINEILGYYRKHQNSNWFKFIQNPEYDLKKQTMMTINKYLAQSFTINKLLVQQQQNRLFFLRKPKIFSIFVNKLIVSKERNLFASILYLILVAQFKMTQYFYQRRPNQ